MVVKGLDDAARPRPPAEDAGLSACRKAAGVAVKLVSNRDMDAEQEIDKRLTELEIKASFSEDLLDQLNQVIVRQQQQIDLLMREVGQLRQQLPEAGTGQQARTGDDLPPHY